MKIKTNGREHRAASRDNHFDTENLRDLYDYLKARPSEMRRFVETCPESAMNMFRVYMTDASRIEKTGGRGIDEMPLDKRFAEKLGALIVEIHGHSVKYNDRAYFISQELGKPIRGINEPRDSWKINREYSRQRGMHPFIDARRIRSQEATGALYSGVYWT